MTISDQNPAEEVTKPFFRHFFFWFGVVLNLVLGGIGLFWIVQMTAFGLIYIQIPAFDWIIYTVWGIHNIPGILIAIYGGFIILGGGLYFLLWRRFLAPLEKEGAVKIGLLAGLLMISGIFPATLSVLAVQFQQWLAISSGYTFTTKLIGTFFGLPILGVCFGAVLGMILVLRPLSQQYHLFVIEERQKIRFGITRRRMQITREPKIPSLSSSSPTTRITPNTD